MAKSNGAFSLGHRQHHRDPRAVPIRAHLPSDKTFQATEASLPQLAQIGVYSLGWEQATCTCIPMPNRWLPGGLFAGGVGTTLRVHLEVKELEVRGQLGGWCRHWMYNF